MEPTTKITITDYKSDGTTRTETDTLYEYDPMHWATWFKDFIMAKIGLGSEDVPVVRENNTYILSVHKPNTYRKIILFKYKFEALSLLEK